MQSSHAQKFEINWIQSAKGELISCKCIADFEILKIHYAEEFSEYIGTDKLETLNLVFMKCSLIFDDEHKEIKVYDDILWDHISLLNRIKYKMPTTASSLESSHGHLYAIQFANGKLTGFHKCVSDGIHLFQTKKINDKASESTEFTSEVV